MSATSVRGGTVWWMLMKERQAWCNFQVKLCDPCLSTLWVCVLCMMLYKYSAFPFLLFDMLSTCLCEGGLKIHGLFCWTALWNTRRVKARLVYQVFAWCGRIFLLTAALWRWTFWLLPLTHMYCGWSTIVQWKHHFFFVHVKTSTNWKE